MGAPDILYFDFSSFQGRAHLFQLQGVSWALEQTWSSGDYYYAFGWSVALNGNRAVIGAPLITDYIAPGAGGEAYSFKRTGAVWNPEQTFYSGNPPDGIALSFGASVACDENLAAVAGYSTDYDQTAFTGTGMVNFYRFQTPASVPALPTFALLLLGGTLLGIGRHQQRSSRTS